jgi:hypothetical protein
MVDVASNGTVECQIVRVELVALDQTRPLRGVRHRADQCQDTLETDIFNRAVDNGWTLWDQYKPTLKPL